MPVALGANWTVQTSTISIVALSSVAAGVAIGLSLRYLVPPLLLQDHTWRRSPHVDRCASRQSSLFSGSEDDLTPLSIEYSEGSLLCQSFEGNSLRTQRWAPNSHPLPTPPAFVVLIHGLHSHVGEAFLNMDYTVDNSMIGEYLHMGCIVFGLDLPGHGFSTGWQGLRGHVQSIDVIVDAVIEFIERVVCQDPLYLNTEGPKPSVFVHGHSLGGLIATLIAIRLAKGCSQKSHLTLAPGILSGMVLTAPALGPAPETLKENALALRLLPLLRCICWVAPWLEFGDAAADSHKEIETRFREDPVCIPNSVRLQMGLDLFRIWQGLAKQFAQIELPFVLLHGTEDRICCPQVSESMFYSATRCSNKHLYLVNGMKHDLMLEPGRHRVFKMIRKWLEKLCAKD